jgi:hypothetical protein
MTTRPTARRIFAAVVSTVLVATVGAVAAPAAHAAQVGTLHLSPATGTALSTPAFVTSGQCQAGDTVRVKMWGGTGTGATVPEPVTINSPGNLVGTIADPTGVISGAGYAIPSTQDFATFATVIPAPLTKLNGTYTVRAWCSPSLDWFEGAVTFTGTDTTTATYVDGAPVTTAPGAPTAAHAVAGDARATVTWAAPASTGGSAITGYTVTSVPSGKTCTTTGALTCAVVGLVDGVKYSFNVKATNAIGTSVASAASNVVTPTGVLRKISAKIITIAGVAKVGKTVKAVIPVKTFFSSTGSIYAGITYTYQWKRGTAVIKGATRSSYKLVKADKGKKVTVVVTAHKVGFRVLAAVSRAIVVK